MSSMYITEPATNGKVCIKTTVGDVDIELWSKECPIACRNFVQLCMEGYYDGCIFHRLVKDFIVQTGDPTGTGYNGDSIYGESFKSEIHQRLKFTRRGLIGMASDNRSQFFITLGKDPTPELDKKHTLFGKIVGDTLFNILKLNDYDVDKNERPTYLHKIISAKILNNPFDDIKIRNKSSEKALKKLKNEKRKENTIAIRNTTLLSFGNEAEEDDIHITTLNQKFKPKSAHDALDDELFSKECAVKPEELGNYVPPIEDVVDNRDKRERLARIKDRLKRNRKRNDDEIFDEDDLDRAVDEQREIEKQKEFEKLSLELNQLKKDYKRSTRKPKEPKIVDEEATTSDGMKKYKKLQLNFKSGTTGIVKQIDPKREDQTMALLQRFKTKLDRSSIQGILTDKMIDMSDQKSREEIILATSAEQGKIDLDAKDLPDESWMVHTLVAPPEDPNGVSKARDANMREHDEDWYPIDHPMNPMNIRKRLAGEKIPDNITNK